MSQTTAQEHSYIPEENPALRCLAGLQVSQLDTETDRFTALGTLRRNYLQLLATAMS